MITDRDTAIRVATGLIARLGEVAEPLEPDGLSLLAIAIVGALGYSPAVPRPGNALTAAQLRDLPPGSLIRNEFDGCILERTANGWRYGWDQVSLSPAFREYTLILLKENPHG